MEIRNVLGSPPPRSRGKAAEERPAAASSDTVTLSTRRAAPTTVVVVDGVKTYLTGSPRDAKTRTTPGLCLMGGGTEVDGALKWMIGKSGGGDFVVLRGDDSGDYNDYIYNDLGGVNSVRTLVIDSREKADSPCVERMIRNAEAVFIAGGDQWEYFRDWNGTRVEKALDFAAKVKKAPLGGTSAGSQSLGGIFYSAERGGVTSDEALADPWHERVTLRNDFLSYPRMKHVIVDSHFHQRDRMGRSATFLAREIEERFSNRPGLPTVIALDEETAVTVDGDGEGAVWSDRSGEKAGSAYFLQASGRPQQCREGEPLTFSGDRIRCYRVKGEPGGGGGFTVGGSGSVGDFSGGEGYYVNVEKGRLGSEPYGPPAPR